MICCLRRIVTGSGYFARRLSPGRSAGREPIKAPRPTLMLPLAIFRHFAVDALHRQIERLFDIRAIANVLEGILQYLLILQEAHSHGARSGIDRGFVGCRAHIRHRQFVEFGFGGEHRQNRLLRREVAAAGTPPPKFRAFAGGDEMHEAGGRVDIVGIGVHADMPAAGRRGRFASFKVGMPRNAPFDLEIGVVGEARDIPGTADEHADVARLEDIRGARIPRLGARRSRH